MYSVSAGVWSHKPRSITIKTPPAAPLKPVISTDVTLNSLTVSWQRPKGRLDYYEVKSCVSRSVDCDVMCFQRLVLSSLNFVNPPGKTFQKSLFFGKVPRLPILLRGKQRFCCQTVKNQQQERQVFHMIIIASLKHVCNIELIVAELFNFSNFNQFAVREFVCNSTMDLPSRIVNIQDTPYGDTASLNFIPFLSKEIKLAFFKFALNLQTCKHSCCLIRRSLFQ